ncbi:F-box/FBD/LRR-repeat protein At1g13570-like isoform X1 [Rosa rugosa]|uniref:F-box/FBD/LRR-repeat protein At1g13570-like isoform X1 n=1 Tax=Rosa rugosa TaxID=74645 RepID=UPI002B414804|nr:F-box/FBD/LRR-repeat protein At1g13570-like isoform X1 [Rosa rugosa]
MSEFQEQRKPSKPPSKVEAELDKISNLPSDVIDIILEHLSIKEAVRTSILSTKWRYKSAMLQNLTFDEQCVSTQNPLTFANIVDQVLLLHIGPIRKFKLSHRDLLATADIDRWVFHLSRSSIKHLILELGNGQRYNLPSCLFSCEDIICLRLRNCILKLPSTFNGFKSLKRLNIERVTLTQNVFEDVIVHCPMLEGLILKNCNGFTHLNIDAPTLKFLVIEGDFEDVNLRNTLNLEYVYIALEFNVKQKRVVGSSSNLLKFVVHLCHIRCLEITSYSLKYLAVGALPGKLPEPLIYLKVLSMSVSFTDLEEITTALCLISSSPALQELEIFVHRDDGDVVGEVNSWLQNLDDNSNYQFTQLRGIEITCISGAKAELDLIKFLLLSSPVLERMTLQPASGDGSLEMLKKVVQFRRASMQAEIIFLDP